MELPPIQKEAILDAESILGNSLPILDAINLDPYNLDNIQTLGQLFNGMIGTFAFIEGIDTFSKVRELAELIDNVSRSYINDGSSPISDEHILFLNTAIGLTEVILSEYVKKGQISENTIKSFSQCLDIYLKLDDVKEKENLSQDDIDNLLDNL